MCVCVFVCVDNCQNTRFYCNDNNSLLFSSYKVFCNKIKRKRVDYETDFTNHRRIVIFSKLIDVDLYKMYNIIKR